MKQSFGLWFLCLFCAITAHAQHDFDILSGEDRKTINFQYANNFILVELRMFGMLPMSFIFDTGAEHTILFKKEFADIFYTSYDLRVPIVGSDQSKEVYALVARNVDIQVNGLDPVERDILVLEEDYLTLDEITGRPIHGILGASFFRNVVVELDFRKQRIVLHRPNTFNPPGKAYQSFPIDIQSGKPYLNTQVTLAGDTTVDVRLLMDTGAGLPLLLHNNTDPRLQLPKEYIRGRLGLGLGGHVEGFLGRIQSLKLGDLAFPYIITSFQDLSESILEDPHKFRNGLIGTQVLMRFHVFIDYIHQEVYLKPVGKYDRRFRMDRSGLIIFAMGRNLDMFVVQDVIPNSPAAEADIRQGDIIRRIGNLPANLYSLDGLLRTLQKQEGKQIRLVIQRRHAILKRKFILRDLI